MKRVSTKYIFYTFMGFRKGILEVFENYANLLYSLEKCIYYPAES